MTGVFRNSSGQWVICYQHRSQASSPLYAELLVLKGLKLVVSQEYKPLVIETYATEVIKALDI